MVHCAVTALPHTFTSAHRRHELLATPSGTSLKMVLFRSFADSKLSSTTLLSGKPMRFVHKQADGTLGSRPNLSGAGSLVYVNTDRHVGNVSSNTVWAVEKRTTPLDGSACDWGETFRLRHVGSGMLLSIEWSANATVMESPNSFRTPLRANVEGSLHAKPSMTVNVTLTNQASDNTLFFIEPQYPSEGYIKLDSFFRLKHVNSDFYIHIDMPVRRALPGSGTVATALR